MLIQTTQEILDYENLPISNGDRGNLTVRDAIVLALNNNAPNENPTAQEKTAELSIEDAAFIKTRSGVISGALMHGRLCQILEAANQIPVESNGQADHKPELAPVE